jgi:WD40 repeat protein
MKMIQPFQAVLEESALQVYSSAIAFVQPTSKIASLYHKTFQNSIPKVILSTWSTTSQNMVLTGHTANIGCISFSPEGKRMASGSSDRTIWLWDTESGAAIQFSYKCQTNKNQSSTSSYLATEGGYNQQ